MIDTNKDIRDMPLPEAQALMFRMFEGNEHMPGGLPLTQTPLMLKMFKGREE